MSLKGVKVLALATVVVGSSAVWADRLIAINFNAGQGRTANGSAENKLADDADAGIPGLAIQGRFWTQQVGAPSLADQTMMIYDTVAGTSEPSFATYTTAARNNYTVGVAGTANVINGYLDDGDQVKVTTSGAPFGYYDVIILASTDSDNRKFAPMLVNGSLYKSDEDGLGVLAESVADTWGQSKTAAITPGTNMVRIRNLVGPLSIIGGRNINNARGGIAAIVIVERTLAVGDQIIFANQDCTASNQGGVGNYKPQTLTIPTVGDLYSGTRLSVNALIFAVESTTAATADGMIVNGVASTGKEVSGQWNVTSLDNSSSMGPKCCYSYEGDTLPEVTVGTAAELAPTPEADSRIRLYATTDEKWSYVILNASMGQWRPACRIVTTVKAVLGMTTATIEGDDNRLSTLDWDPAAPTASDTAKLVVQGTTVLNLDADITAASVKVLGSEALVLTGSNLTQANFDKFDFSEFAGKIVFRETSFVPSAPPAVGRTYRFEGTAETALDALPYSQAAMLGTVELAKPLRDGEVRDYKLRQNAVVFDEGFSMTASAFQLGNQNNNTVQTFTQKGGTITLTSATTATAQAMDVTEGVPLLMAHWPSTITYDLLGGSLLVPNGLVALGRDGKVEMTVGGAETPAVFQALGISNDSRGNTSDRTAVLTVATNGTLRLGEQGTYLGTSGKRMVLAGGTVESYETNTIADPDNAIEVSADSTFAVPAGKTSTVTATLSGAGTVTKCGAGTLAFTNTLLDFTGAFVLEAGTLRVPAGKEGTLVVPAGATLVLSVTTEQKGLGYTATGVTFAEEHADKNIVFINPDGSVITEGASGTTLEAEAIHISAAKGNSPYVVSADNLPTLALVVEPDGVIDVNGVFDVSPSIILNGGVLRNGGAAIGEGKMQYPTIRLTADSTVEATANFGTIASGFGAHDIVLDGHTLTKVGPGSFWIKNATFVGGGVLDVQAGTVKFDNGLAQRGGAVTLAVAEGAHAWFAGTTPVPFGRITGAGRLTCSVVPETDLSDGDWTGTAVFSGEIPLDLSRLGNAGSKVVFNGVRLVNVAGKACPSPIELVDNGDTPALTFGDWGYGVSFSAPKLTGTGTIRTEGFSWYAYHGAFKFADLSEYAGSIAFANTQKGGMWVVSGDETPDYPEGNDGQPHGAIWVSEGSTFGLGGTANSLNATNTVKGTLKVQTASAELLDTAAFAEGSKIDISTTGSMLTLPSTATGAALVVATGRSSGKNAKVIAWDADAEPTEFTAKMADRGEGWNIVRRADGYYLVLQGFSISIR